MTTSPAIKTPFLTHDELITYSSIMAERPSGKTSSRYSFIPTTRIIEQFEAMGFYPVKVNEAKANEARKGFQKHIVRFRQPGATAVGLDQIFPEIVLVNSHDAGAAFHLMAGLFRLICTNGMIVGESLTGTVKINHIGYTDMAVREAVQTIGDRLPLVMGRMDEFKALELTPADRAVYAVRALGIKYGPEEVGRRDFQIPALIEPKRTADQAPDLWSTYNTVQEKLVETGAQLERRTLQRQRWDYRVRAYRNVTKMANNKPANGPTENVRVNQGLWELTEKIHTAIKARGHFSPELAEQMMEVLRAASRTADAKKG
jgi:hypothetical protein